MNYTFDKLNDLLNEKNNYTCYAICRKECFIGSALEFSKKQEDELGEYLEIHVFDETEEYRWVKNAISNENFIKVSDEKMSEKKKFTDTMVLDKDKDKGILELVNYYTYSDDGMIEFVNYRFVNYTKGGQNG